MTVVFKVIVKYCWKIFAWWELSFKEKMESIIKGLKKTGIMETVKSAHDTYTRCKNPFDNRCR